MLYLIESGIYAKIGYTSDNKTLEKRLSSYQTHNPSFRLLDTAEGSEEDEKRLQALYKDYKVYFIGFELHVRMMWKIGMKGMAGSEGRLENRTLLSFCEGSWGVGGKKYTQKYEKSDRNHRDWLILQWF